MRSYLVDEILTIEFDSPEQSNCFGLKEAEFIQSLDFRVKNSAENFSVVFGNKNSRQKLRALMLTNQGRVFCSGGNLRAYALLTIPQQIVTNRKIRKVLDQVSRLPIPTAVAMNGDCLGGGIELISCFDYVVSAPHCGLGLWQRRMGLTLGWGGGKRLLKRLPHAALIKLALESRFLSAYEALNMGVIDQIAPASTVVEQARYWLNGQIQLAQRVLAAYRNWSPVNEAKVFDRLWKQRRPKD